MHEPPHSDSTAPPSRRAPSPEPSRALFSTRWLPPELLGKALGALKASAYLALVSLVLLAASTRAARGALGEVSLTLARQLSEVSDLVGSTKVVELNGQPFRVSTTVARLSASQVLDRFSSACTQHPGQLARVAAQHGLADLQDARGRSGWGPLVRLDG
jgi:hypothetical protein